LIADKTTPCPSANGIAPLAAAGVPVWIDYAARIAHAKTMVIDGAVTLTGSMNWTRGPATATSPGMTKIRFALDSPLEKAGFEPSVPRGAIKVSRGAHLVSARFPANGKVGSHENRLHDDAGRLPRDRWFESCSLQRRVCLTSAFRGRRRKDPAFAASVSLDGTRERDVLATSRLALALFSDRQ
jgi:hypothetical protein